MTGLQQGGARRRRARTLLALCAMVAALGVGVASTRARAAASAKPTTHAVTIHAFRFLPDTLTVNVGDTVVWTNQDIVPHTATAKGGAWDSGSIEAKASWRHVVREKGTFEYGCAFHPTMTAVLVVR